jgi:multiple sugar transport system substrate-binding protein
MVPRDSYSPQEAKMFRKARTMWAMYVILAMVAVGCAATATPTQAPQATSTETAMPQATDTPAQAAQATNTPTEAPQATNTPTTAPQPTNTPAPTPTQPPLDISGSIRIGTWDSADALLPFNEAIQSFEAAYPDVTVLLEAVPQDYGTKLLAEFAAGTAPDIFQVGDGDVANFVSKGVVEPLTPYMDGSKGNDPLNADVFYPNIAKFGQVDGTYYLLTKDYSPLVLYYNKDLFQAAGVDTPTADWQWQDLVDAAIKLTVDKNGNTADSADFDPTSIQQWGLQIPDTWGDSYWLRGIEPLIFQNGGSIISSDGTQTTGHLNSAQTVEALQFYVDLFNKHHVAATTEDVQARPGVDFFQSNLAAMVWTGRWPVSDYEKNPDLNFGTVQLPAGPSGTEANVLCWAGFGMYSGGTNKDAAWAFLRYIAAGQGAKAFAGYAFTDVKSIAEEQGLTSNPYTGPIVDELQYVVPIPALATPKFSECVGQSFSDEIQKIFLQDKDVQTAMDDAASAADTCLSSGS